MYIFKIPHFCNNKCIYFGSKLYQQPLCCQLPGTRQPLRKPISTSLLGWTSRTPDFTSTTLPPGPSKMFCTTLRRRPSYASALSSLIATDGLKLRGESHRPGPQYVLTLRAQRTGWKLMILPSHCLHRWTPTQAMPNRRASCEFSFWHLPGHWKPPCRILLTASTTSVL